MGSFPRVEGDSGNVGVEGRGKEGEGGAWGCSVPWWWEVEGGQERTLSQFVFDQWLERQGWSTSGEQVREEDIGHMQGINIT